MYVFRNLAPKIVFNFAWKPLLTYALYGTGVYFLFHWLEHLEIDATIPFLPLSTIGIAVAFYVGFKNNQAYDRFWEGRKIWGGIVNTSRTWGNQVLSYLTQKHSDGSVSDEELKKIQKRLIYRQMAWMNSLRLQLRRESSFSINFNSRQGGRYHHGRPEEKNWKEEVGKFVLEEMEVSSCLRVSNTATQLIRLQGEDLKGVLDKGLIEDFRHMELMHSLAEFTNLQGACERIKNTPFPRQYAYFSTIFTWIFIFLLPFGLIGQFKDMGHDLMWLMIPFYVLISWIFYTMEAVGDSSEDPFENFINDVPMTALCRTIEIDLREMLGETDLPERIKPIDGVLL
jgi:putative membrane protein